ncbi:MAG: tetratricopeptide repeat protein [Halieaceae bacterium]|jgi:tetratricopeptide (TPR) repeat protein|nr:tetratricopeptide repeat protein [Halieaceae bacterium]
MPSDRDDYLFASRGSTVTECGTRAPRERHLLAALLSVCLIAGCATSGDGSADRAGGIAEGDSAGDLEASGSAPEAPIDPPVPERPIPEGSVYPLLVAEFALRRRDFDTALKTYLEQAEILRDPAVSAHATHLAQFLQREREAFRAVRLWVELEPDNVEANDTLGMLLARQGRTREALPHFALVARAGEAARFPMLLSGFKAMPAAEQTALDYAVQVLLNDDLGDNLSLLLTHALMAEEAGNPGKVRERLEPVFAIDPYQQQALVLDAKLRVADDDPEPFQRIEKALEVDGSRHQLRLQYARLLAASDMPAAREQFEILSEASPHDANLLFSLALLNHELEDNTAARAYLDQVIQLGQRRDEAYLFLGQIEASEGNREEAIQMYQQVGDGEDLLRATLNIAKLQLAADRDEELRLYMNRLRESYPQRREQLFALEANIYSEAERDEQGIEVLERAIDEYPESDNLRYARSVLFERRGDIAAAEEDLRAILARDPKNSTALNALGYTLANRTDRYEEALALIEAALRLSPDEPAILDSMGWVLYHLGEYERALAYLTRAYTQFPDPEVAAHLGEVLWVSGDTTAAMKVWRGALMREPEHVVLNETLDRLGVSLQALRSP